VRHNDWRTLRVPRQFRPRSYACDGIPMTVRGGGFPTSPLAFMPIGRMGPPLRSFAADAHDCIVVPVLGPTAYKVVARLNRARNRHPLGFISGLDHRAQSRQDEAWRDQTKNPTMEKMRHPA